MLVNKTVTTVLLVVGIGVFVASLLADLIGIGTSPGFGNVQLIGTIAGAVITCVGLFFRLRKT